MRRLVALLVVLAALPAAANAAQAASGPASTLQVSASRVLYGHSVTLMGRISSLDSGRKVIVLAQPYGRPGTTRAATVVTRPGGYWSYRASPGIQTGYAVRIGAKTSRTRIVGVQPNVTAEELGSGKLLVHVLGGRSFSGRSVAVQRLGPGGAWRTVSRNELGTHSTAAFTTSVPTSTIRVALSVNQAGAGYLGGLSHALRYHAYSLTLTPSSYTTVFGVAVTLSGRLVGGAAGQRVSVLERQFGRSSPRLLARVSTQAGGRWSVSIRPAIQVSFWAEWAGSEKSRLVTIGVAPRLSIRELANGDLKSHVDAARAFKGRVLKLQQRLPNGAWRTLAHKRVDSESDVIFQTPLATSTIRFALSVNQAGAGFLGATSYELRYRPPGITLLSETRSVRYGHTLALTGRLASSEPGLKIGIFARSYGQSAPSEIATVSTDPNGGWRYRARPSVQTSYFARFGSMSSTRLTIGVRPSIAIVELSNGDVVARVVAARSFIGRKVELQRLAADGAWVTLARKKLDRSSAATFAPTLPVSKLRVAMSVNQAGSGFLAASSTTLSYRG